MLHSHGHPQKGTRTNEFILVERDRNMELEGEYTDKQKLLLPLFFLEITNVVYKYSARV